jgi:hypothetical protein
MYSLALLIVELQTAKRRLIRIFEEPDGTSKERTSLRKLSVLELLFRHGESIVFVFPPRARGEDIPREEELYSSGNQGLPRSGSYPSPLDIKRV